MATLPPTDIDLGILTDQIGHNAEALLEMPAVMAGGSRR